MRIVKQWRRPGAFQLNQRLDVLDQKGKWLEANIVQIEADPQDPSQQAKIRVHFKGFTQRWDEDIDIKIEGETRIKEVGALSKGLGWAKTNQPYQDRLHKDKENIERSAQEVKEKIKANRFENAKQVMRQGLNTSSGH
jgi:predicted metal-dependent hydrolase